MEIDRQVILDLIAQHGDTQALDEARRTLPPQVDPVAHAGLLMNLGIEQPELFRFAGIDPASVRHAE